MAVETPTVEIVAKTASMQPPFRVKAVNLNGADVGLRAGSRVPNRACRVATAEWGLYQRHVLDRLEAHPVTLDGEPARRVARTERAVRLLDAPGATELASIARFLPADGMDRPDRRPPRADSATARPPRMLPEASVATAGKLRRILGVSFPVASSALEELRGAGILDTRTIERNATAYVATEVLDLIA